MTARILVVDDIEANVKVLEGRLLAQYFDVTTATNGFTALEICQTQSIDLVLLDIMMPGMDGFEVCERLKSDIRTAHIPVVMVTALDQPSDRLRGLKSGADDFLTKPVNDVQLIARVKSLVRLKSMSDELRLRAEAIVAIGADEGLLTTTDVGAAANIMLVDPRQSSRERIERALRPVGRVRHVSEPNAALLEAAHQDFELIVVNLNASDSDPLRLCAQFRNYDRTRFIPILLGTDQDDDRTVVQALELGVNDYIARPIDPNELVARSLTQIKRKRYNDRLRSGLQSVMDMAVVDPLTGLHNRRYLDSHLKVVFERARQRHRPLSLAIMDIDHFKAINDTYGHLAGDRVLQDIANCLRTAVRGADLLCRYGGEEFVIIMPETEVSVASKVSERLREMIAARRFSFGDQHEPITVTASFGLVGYDESYKTPNDLMHAADIALYRAKTEGRNRVHVQSIYA